MIRSGGGKRFKVFQVGFEREAIVEGVAYLALLDQNLCVFGATGH